ncbi:allophanate hydrolase [Thermococci archaeon]|nr:MAG: allophanate hydrolase [Thermococci archaeon]
MLRIINGGIQSLVVDWPGRVGYLNLGFAPSGPFDHFAARVANLIVGNPTTEAVVEIAAGYFAAEFTTNGVIAITGADLKPMLNGEVIPLWEAIEVKKGDIFESGKITKDTLGFREYLAIAGGFDVPIYMGSKTTSLYGGFGGYKGRVLKTGDILPVVNPSKEFRDLVGRRLNSRLIPKYGKEWQLRAIPGPNSAPDFFAEEGMELFFSTKFQAQIESDRSGIRLSGPKPIWSREREKERGHPSNILDHGYPVPGTVNVTGDTPIILGPEGPTLGGFVCAMHVVYADQWKLGQIYPGRDIINFKHCTLEEAIHLRKEQNSMLMELVYE